MVGTGAVISTKNQVESFQDNSFNKDVFRATSKEELGLDPLTGQISSTSPLVNHNAYGLEWVKKWNERFNLEQCGIITSTNDKIALK